jgi:uncharacterized protein
MTASVSETVPGVDDFAAVWNAWHGRQEARLSDPHGFLAITSLNWLTEEPQRFSDAPGEWSAGPDGVVVDLAEGEELVIGGSPVRGRYSFGVIPERGGVNAVWGDAVIEVARRGGNDIVRPRHPGHHVRVSYGGTPAYAPDRDWVIEGRYAAFDEPRAVTVGAVVEGLQHVYEAPGQIEFDVRGQVLRLTAFNGKTPGSLNVLFTDATSGVTTYAANRALPVDAPDGRGVVTLDFNRAVNLPCAYTEFATCPLPPAENRLPVAVEAGEKMPDQQA